MKQEHVGSTAWQGSLYDIAIRLDQDSKRPMYEQIYQHLKQEIQAGALSRGQRLPSTRYLASYLQISRTTVDLAYGQLLSEGYIEAVPCKGYYVSDLEGLYHLEAAPGEIRENKAQGELKPVCDFTPSGVDLTHFPHATWRRLSRSILTGEDQTFLQLGDAQGEPALRETISAYLHRARGMSVAPERIVVGAGNDFLLLLLCSMLGTGLRYAMESPTYRKAYDLLRSLSNDVCVVPHDAGGMCTEELEKSRAKIAYVMPSHQFPLGTVMPVKRRIQLLEWAARAEDRYIIEDDYDSEFRYRGKPIPALQGFDQYDKVIYLGTFSKSVAPAIRISYLVLPVRLMDLYRQRGLRISSTVPRMDQLVITEFIRGGYFERHLNRMRSVYKSRHDLLLEELRPLRGVASVSGENAGVHLLLTFQNGMTEQEAIRRAAACGVRVYGLSAYAIGPDLPSKTVLLGYATVEEEVIRKGVPLLCKAWEGLESDENSC